MSNENMASEFDLTSAVFVNGFFTIEAFSNLPGFVLPLGPDIGLGVFERIDAEHDVSPRKYVLRRVLSAPAPAPYPTVASLGVLWTRRAALEAHQSIVSYQAGVDQIVQSSG